MDVAIQEPHPHSIETKDAPDLPTTLLRIHRTIIEVALRPTSVFPHAPLSITAQEGTLTSHFPPPTRAPVHLILSDEAIGFLGLLPLEKDHVLQRSEG